MLAGKCAVLVFCPSPKTPGFSQISQRAYLYPIRKQPTILAPPFANMHKMSYLCADLLHDPFNYHPRQHSVQMETTRQQKIGRLIQKELGDIFQRQTQQMRGVLISVSAARISPDLSVCKVYLSVFPSERGEEIIRNVTANMRSIRYELGTRVRHQLRIIPELKFFQDDSLDYIDHIDKLLS